MYVVYLSVLRGCLFVNYVYICVIINIELRSTQSEKERSVCTCKAASIMIIVYRKYQLYGFNIDMFNTLLGNSLLFIISCHK